MTSTKTFHMIKLLREKPGLKSEEAEKKGFSKSTFYLAKKMIKEEEASRPERSRHDALTKLIEQLDAMGIIELHYKNKELEVVRAVREKVSSNG